MQIRLLFCWIFRIKENLKFHVTLICNFIIHFMSKAKQSADKKKHLQVFMRYLPLYISKQNSKSSKYMKKLNCTQQWHGYADLKEQGIWAQKMSRKDLHLQISWVCCGANKSTSLFFLYSFNYSYNFSTFTIYYLNILLNVYFNCM